MTGRSPEEVRALIEEARAATEDVTEGPWFRIDPPFGRSDWVGTSSDGNVADFICQTVMCFEEDDTGEHDSLADAAFIAASRSLVPKLADALASLLDERDAYRKRVGEQRKHIASLERKVAALQSDDAPDASPDEIVESQSVYLERVEAARERGDVEWLVDEVLKHDEQKQNLIHKNRQLRRDVSGVPKLRAERDGAARETAELRKQLAALSPPSEEAPTRDDAPCEVCGKPGKAYLGGALCDAHRDEFETWRASKREDAQGGEG